jgi:hypothetical protein
LSFFSSNHADIFSCNVNNLPSNYEQLAKNSYNKYGVFFIKGVVSRAETNRIRSHADQLFGEAGDKRLRFLRNIKNKGLRYNLVKAFMNRKLLDLLSKIFSNLDVSLLPPFNIAKNYLPHSIDTEAMGWHRDCNGEMSIKQCREILENTDYVFGKIGLYLQDNSEYGGAIDIVPGSNRDFLSFPKGWSAATFWIKFLIFLQRYMPIIYRKIANTRLMKYLIGTTKTRVEAGDVVVFDSRVFHKGTPAHEDVEETLVYHHDRLQADLPEGHTKYVLYAQFGNSIGIKSYFLDRLDRIGGHDEVNEWVNDTCAIDLDSDNNHAFFRKKQSLLDGSFKNLFN